jgi:hypothetical protein
MGPICCSETSVAHYQPTQQSNDLTPEVLLAFSQDPALETLTFDDETDR